MDIHHYNYADYPQQVSLIPQKSPQLPIVTETGRYTLTCNASRNPAFSNMTTLDVIWLDPTNNPISPSNGYFVISGDGATTCSNLSSTLTFNYVRTSQAGPYTCVVNMTVPGLVRNYSVGSTLNITVRSE